MMPGEAMLFLFAVIMSALLLFMMVFFVCISVPKQKGPGLRLTTPCTQVIMFSDLECDYINPIDLCNKLNQVGCRVGGCWRARCLYVAL